MLVRKGGRRADSDERHWFLFKERDKFAKPSLDITEESPLSVTTGRDLDEIAEQANRVWGRNGEVSQNGHKKNAAKRVASKSKVRSAVEESSRRGQSRNHKSLEGS